MAGGVLKGFGGLFLALGILLVLAGIGAAVYASMAQQENENQGPLGVGEDGNESDQNEAILMGAAAAGAVGLVLVIVSIILLVSGGARGRRALERAIREGHAQRAPPTTTSPADGPAAAPDAAASGTAAPATAASSPRAASNLSASKGAASSRAAATPSMRQSDNVQAARRPPAAAIFVAIGVGLVAIIVVIALFTGGGNGLLGDNPFGDRSNVIGNVTIDGNTASTFSIFGVMQDAGDGDAEKEFDVPAGTGRLELTASWNPTATGASTLNVQVEALVDDAWTVLQSGAGGPGFMFNVTDGPLTEAPLRIVVMPDGTAGAQDFNVLVRFLRE